MLDTADENRRRHDLHPDYPVWLFGYGSLIYKAEYLLQLAEALRQLNVGDEHVFHIEHYLLHASD